MKQRFRIGFILGAALLMSTPAIAETTWIEKSGKVVPNTESQQCQNDFCGWLMPTRDLDWKAKWDTPSSDIPEWHGAETIHRGDKIVILIFYSHPLTDDQGIADIGCDVRLIRPDGSFNINQSGVPCAKGKLVGDANLTRLTQAVINFTAEPHDLAGKWTVEVDLKDKVRGVSLPLRAAFEIKEAEGNIVSRVEYQVSGGFSTVQAAGVIVTEYPEGCELRRYQKTNVATNDGKNKDYNQVIPISKTQCEDLWGQLEAKDIWNLRATDKYRLSFDMPHYFVRAQKNSKEIKISQTGPSDEFQSIISILDHYE